MLAGNCVLPAVCAMGGGEIVPNGIISLPWALDFIVSTELEGQIAMCSPE